MEAIDYHQYLFRVHDGPDAHGISFLGHIIKGSKKPGVGVNGALGKGYTVGSLCKSLIGLIKTYMAVIAKA